MMTKKLAAEFIGTFTLVLFGCGSAVLAGEHVGQLGIALAFGLSIVAMAYAIGPISGCHINPAVSLSMFVAKRMSVNELTGYVIAQCLGAIVGAAMLYLIASGAAGFDVAQGFASNGYGEHSPGGYGLWAAMLTEIVMTMIFLFVIIGSTSRLAPQSFAPIAIGLCLTLIHLISIPVTNTSVNPARSTGVAIYAGGWALAQLWLFWVAPIIGGALGALLYRFVRSDREVEAVAQAE